MSASTLTLSLKTCTKCVVPKPLGEFVKDRQKKHDKTPTEFWAYQYEVGESLVG